MKVEILHARTFAVNRSFIYVVDLGRLWQRISLSSFLPSLPYFCLLITNESALPDHANSSPTVVYQSMRDMSIDAPLFQAVLAVFRCQFIISLGVFAVVKPPPPHPTLPAIFVSILFLGMSRRCLSGLSRLISLRHTRHFRRACDRKVPGEGKAARTQKARFARVVFHSLLLSSS